MSDENKPDEQKPVDPIPADPVEPDVDTLSDPEIDKAVDDIVVHEGDELLEHQDDDRAQAEAVARAPRRGFFSWWWHSRLAHWLTFLLIVGGLIAVAFVPKTRYWSLNLAGVRASSSVTVVDDLTSEPLKNVQVTIDGATAKTDSSGKAKLVNIKLGPQQLKIEHAGFATITDQVTVGWGSNPLGSYPLKAVGIQYKLLVRDALTGQPIQGAEANSGDSAALSDKNGNILLTVPGTGTEDLPVIVSNGGFRTEQIVIKAGTTSATTVKLITSLKAVYVSKETGKYDLYTADADGKNRKVVLPGTGNENANIAVVVSPSGDHAAIVSTRDNQHDSDGYLLATLTMVNLSDGTSTTLGHAEQIQLVDWIGTRLVFEQVASDSSSPATRYNVISYDYANNSRLQLAAARKLNTVLSAHGVIYYAVAPDPENSEIVAAMYKINPDASNKQTVLDKEVWTTYRTDYNTLSMQTADGWFTYNIGTNATSPVAGPSAYSSRIYSDNADGTHSLWADPTQGALMVYDNNKGKDEAPYLQSGLGYPVRWLTGNTAIYRVATGSETADYAVSTLGGQPPVKVADVTNTYGFTQGQ